MDERLEKIYSELEIEIKSKLGDAQGNDISISNKLKKFHELATKIIKENCKKSFDWIQENTNQETNDNGVQFVIKDQNKMEDAQKYFKEFKECSEKFDLGIRNEIENSRREISSLNDGFMSCSESCVSNGESKKDSEIKNCLTNCFDISFEKSKSIQTNLIGKIDDILYKLNKF